MIMNLQNISKFNDVGVFEIVKGVLRQERKEQDSCDTQK